jgi:hypothetical protein
VINKHKNISGDSVFLRWPLAFFITMTITLYLVFSAYPEAATDSGSVDPELDELYEQLTQTKAIASFQLKITLPAFTSHLLSTIREIARRVLKSLESDMI